MAMVIMSPLSELTDTDGFEMRSISRRGPPPTTQRPSTRAPPPLPAPALLLPESVKHQRAACRVTVGRRQGQVQQSERSGGSCDSRLDPFWCTSGPPQPPETLPTGSRHVPDHLTESILLLFADETTRRASFGRASVVVDATCGGAARRPS